MRRRVIAGNWKMYKTIAETRAFFSAFAPLILANANCDIVVAPPFTAIAASVEATKNSKIAICGQNVFWSTKARSPERFLLRCSSEAGCRYVIIGHSERRQLFRETDENVARNPVCRFGRGPDPHRLRWRNPRRTRSRSKRTPFERSSPRPRCVDRRRILSYSDGIRASLGDRDRQKCDAGNRCRRAQLSAPMRGPAIFAGPCRRLRIFYGGSVKPENIKA